MSDADTRSTNVSFIKQIVDKKFSKSNVALADMMKNKAMSVIDDFKNSFKYVPNASSPTTEPKGETSTETETDNTTG